MDEKLPYFVVSEEYEFADVTFFLKQNPSPIPIENETLAFAISIKKWELVAELHEKYDVVDGGTNWTNCGLCWLNNNFNKGCSECPIMKKTGNSVCHGTPFENYNDYSMEVPQDHSPREIAQQELGFLKDLAVERGIDLNNLPEIEVVWEK